MPSRVSSAERIVDPADVSGSATNFCRTSSGWTPGHISVEQLLAPADELGVLTASDLIALGDRACVDAVTTVRPDTLRPLDGCRGISEQRSRLARLAAADDPVCLAQQFVGR